MGYQVETHGQKGFNGVAILSKLPLTDVVRGRPGDPADEQAHWIEAAAAGVRIYGLYLPNGNPAADRLTGAGIDKAVRGGDKPSDHVPVWLALAA